MAREPVPREQWRSRDTMTLGGGVMIAHGIELESTAIREFCRRWQIRQLFVFGSVLRADFGPESDVDFLFELEPSAQLTMDSWIAMEDELTAIVGRRVDLVPRK